MKAPTEEIYGKSTKGT